MKFAKLFFPVVAVVLAGVGTVHAESMKAECYERANLLYSLATEFDEKLDQTRRVGASGLLEAFKSASNGTWTIVYSNDDGLSCVLATGGGLETDDDSADENSEFSA